MKYTIGSKWGSKTVIARLDSDIVRTKCDCGTVQMVRASDLRFEHNCFKCADRTGTRKRSEATKEKWLQSVLNLEKSG